MATLLHTAPAAPAAGARPPGAASHPPPPWRLLGHAATGVAFLVLAWVLAQWGWRLLGPAPVHIAAAEPADPAATIEGAGLFGSGAPSVATTDGASPALATLGGDTRLLGVFAEPEGKGYAVFHLSAGSKVVAAGQEISPGILLVAVHPDAITVRDGSGEHALALRAVNAPATKARTGASPAPSKATSPISTSSVSAPRRDIVANSSAAAVRMACRPPAGFKGQVVQINAELLGGLIAQPDSWRGLIEPANGALTIRDANGFAAMLGLQSGDRVEQANGIALRVAEDVVAAVLRPLVANQPVRVSGRRGSEPRELWIVNVGCQESGIRNQESVASAHPAPTH